MKLKSQKAGWIASFIIFTILIGVILLTAYLGKIPHFIGAIPYYDKIGHFVLYGIWSYIFWRATKRKTLYKVPIAPAIITVFTIIEEYLQIFSENRTASSSDLLFSLAGIWIVILIDKNLRHF